MEIKPIVEKMAEEGRLDIGRAIGASIASSPAYRSRISKAYRDGSFGILGKLVSECFEKYMETDAKREVE